ncbi:hypothetical protein [Nocardioides pyridinolyticus]
MFPEAPVIGTSDLPAAATFWMPSPVEISEEGFGFFRDTWLIRNVSVGDAREIISIEWRMAEVVGRLAKDGDDFERLAGIAESAALDDPAEEVSAEELHALAEVVSDIPELCGLELGVAGLVHALASVQVLPAASCRSHPERSWSDAPVVLFAATEFRARALQPLVEETGCTFGIDAARPNLLVVRGRSIENTMALADAVVENRKSFVQPRVSSSPRRDPSPSSTQEQLF